MTSRTDEERGEISLTSALGRDVHVIEDDEVVHLLNAAIEREGSQSAFARRYGVNRSYLNMVLNGKRPLGGAVAETLGLRKMYMKA